MKPTTAQCSWFSMKNDSDAPSCMWADLVNLALSDFHNARCMIICWVLLWKKGKSLMSYYCRHLQSYHLADCKYQKRFLLYVLKVVPPRTCRVSALWHCNVAMWLVTLLNERTACEELTVFDRLSSMCLLFSVQKILPWTHEVWHTISALDPTSMYRSLGTTLHALSCRPAGNNNGEWNSTNSPREVIREFINGMVQHFKKWTLICFLANI